MPCDRLLFISGHKSNSFHNSTDFFHLATFIHRHFLHCTQYPLTQLSNMHYYFILSVQFLLPSRLNCMHIAHAQYHISFGGRWYDRTYRYITLRMCAGNRDGDMQRMANEKCIGLNQKTQTHQGIRWLCYWKSLKVSVPKNCEIFFSFLLFILHSQIVVWDGVSVCDFFCAYLSIIPLWRCGSYTHIFVLVAPMEIERI